MALSSIGNTGKFLNEEWHDTRQEARESLGLFEWGDIDIVRYDLDGIQFDRKARATETRVEVEAETAAKSGEPLQGFDVSEFRD
jgi:hypothetical protein